MGIIFFILTFLVLTKYSHVLSKQFLSNFDVTLTLKYNCQYITTPCVSTVMKAVQIDLTELRRIAQVDEKALLSLSVSSGFKGGGRWGQPEFIQKLIFQKSRLSHVKAYSSLCAFAIKDDGADTLSSDPLFKILGSATAVSHTNEVP